MAEMNATGFCVRSSANRSALPLERARHRVRRRHHHERHRSAASSSSGSPATSSDAAQPGRAGQRRQHPRREIEAGDNQRALEDNALPDVAVHVVRDLVRQHDLDLVVRVFREHRVGDQDPPRAAEPGQRRIGLLRLRRQGPTRTRRARARRRARRAPSRRVRSASRLERLDASRTAAAATTGARLVSPTMSRANSSAGGQPPVLRRAAGCSQ